MKKACKTCKHWARNPYQVQSECHALTINSDMIYIDELDSNNMNYKTLSVYTSPDFYCALYQMMDKPKPKNK